MPFLQVFAPAAHVGPRGPSGSMKSTVILSAANIMALHTTPQQLVPAVPGKTITPYFVWFELDDVTTPYSADEVAHFGWTAVPSGFVWCAPTLTLNGNTVDFGVQISPAAPILGGHLSDLQGAPFYLDLAADVTTGDGTAKITTYYEAN